MVQIEGKTNTSSKKICLHDRKNVIKKKNKTMADPQEKPKRSVDGGAKIKPRTKEMNPICKRRKKFERDSPTSKREEEDFVWLFSQANQHESLWLSSESLSPLYKGSDVMFMNLGDYSIDEQLVSFLSSHRGISFFDGFNANAIKNDLLEDSKEDDAESWLLDPIESTIGSSCEKSCIDDSSSTALSKCSEASSLFWDLDRTDMWVSLINLEGEDCKWISNLDLDSENLESNFPSPTCENKVSFFDVHSSDADVDVSSSMRSFHDELSSELLSGSLDLDDMEFDEPLMWPFDDKYESNYTSYVFCQSPRKGLGSSISSLLKNDARKVHSKEWLKRKFVASLGLSASKFIAFKRGNTKVNRSSRNSMKMMLSASKPGKKHKFRKGNFVMSAKGLQAMSLVGIDDEFNWLPCKESIKYSASSHTNSSTSSSMDFDNGSLWVSLINLNGEDSEWSSEAETDWERGSNSNFPSPSYKNFINKAFWSSKNGFSFQDELSVEILSDEMDYDEPLFWPYGKDQNWSMAWDSFCTSPRKGVFGNPGSIRVRIHDQRAGFKRSIVAVSGLSASKINGFKRGNGKKGNAKRAKAMNSRIGRSDARKFARNVGERMDVIMENDVEGVAVEKIIGFQEFDGHEGLDVEFHTESFSILEE